MQKIILASQSPRRKQLLQWAEIDFEVIVQPTRESYPDHLTIEEIPIHIARNKALAVKQEQPAGSIILAADTVVVVDNKIIGKPADKMEAMKFLSLLSGKRHLVITGVVILQDAREIAFADITEVWFNELSPAQLEYYVDKYNPLDKAGAYAIQEWIGVIGIQKISGDFYNVMGLPVSRVVRELGRMATGQ
jgi:septum formation protein